MVNPGGGKGNKGPKQGVAGTQPPPSGGTPRALRPRVHVPSPSGSAGSVTSSPAVSERARSPVTAEGIVESLGVIPAGEPEASRAVEFVYQMEELARALEGEMFRTRIGKENRLLFMGRVDEMLGVAKDMAVDFVRLEGANRSLHARAGESTVEAEIRSLREEVARLVSGVGVSGRSVDAQVVPPGPVPVPAPRLGRRSYADMAAGLGGAARAPGAVLVEPRDTEAGLPNADAVKTRLQESIDPVREGFQVVSVRKRGARVEVRTATVEGARRILDCRERLEGAGLRIREVGRRDPRLVLYDVPRTLSGEEALEAARRQNSGGDRNLEGDWGKFLYYAGPRQGAGGKRHVVFSVSPSVRGVLLGKGYLAVGWDHCRVDDFIDVNRCGKCLLYGHMQRDCKREITCQHCAVVGHLRSACPALDRPGVCAACKSLGRPDDHPLRSGDCPAYRRMYQRVVEMTNYDG